MLAWEYPPFVVGGIAAHVDGLSRALVRSGHEVVVLSFHHDGLTASATIPDDIVVAPAFAADAPATAAPNNPRFFKNPRRAFII